MKDAISLSPNNESYRLLLAQIYVADEQFELANQELLILHETFPENPHVLLELGKVLLYDKKDYCEALKMLNIAGNLIPSSLEINNALGVANYK